MSIFETIFAYILVFPNIEWQLQNLFKSQEKEVDESYAKKLAKDEVNALLMNAKVRELKQKSTINVHAKAFAVLLSFVLAVVTFILALRILKFRKSDIVAPTIHGIITVLILIMFQIHFYYFGQKYNYMSPNEIQPKLLNELCENVDTDTSEVEGVLKKDVTKALQGLTEDVITKYIDDEKYEKKYEIAADLSSVKEFMGHIENSFE